jgi:ubiquinone/menaquinone biosynthesis C-methylase UbiE
MPRLIARELMDDDTTSGDPTVWRGSLHDLARVNRLLGGRRLLRLEIDRIEPLPRTILDVATGNADLPIFMLDHLKSRGVAATCVAVDRSAKVLSIAAERIAGRADIRLQQADATALPFPDKSFDLATIVLAFHHFDGDAAIAVLRELARVAKNVIVNDLRRSWLAWAFARYAFPLFTRNMFTLSDAPMSVLRAYTPDEAYELARTAGWTKIAVRRYPGYRMALVGGTE